MSGHLLFNNYKNFKAKFAINPNRIDVIGWRYVSGVRSRGKQKQQEIGERISGKTVNCANHNYSWRWAKNWL